MRPALEAGELITCSLERCCFTLALLWSPAVPAWARATGLMEEHHLGLGNLSSV